ncbi:MAG: flavin-containing monooxygenase, partial [Solirubrobacterales bacterium]
MTSPSHHRIAIVGSGFSGLGMAVRLKQEGIHDFVVLERAEDLGGTWRDNNYPGCACDVPSHLYSFSFAPNPDWSRTFSPQPEIWEYLRRVSAEHGVDPHIRYRHEVTAARWDEQAELWQIQTTAGELTADLLVAGAGPLSDPKLPDIPGIDTFDGAIFHSAQWDHDHVLDGERVAVIGTGASSIQIVPRIQPKVGRLHVFQRTPPW